jgi:hypothetical protein
MCVCVCIYVMLVGSLFGLGNNIKAFQTFMYHKIMVCKP